MATTLVRVLLCNDNSKRDLLATKLLVAALEKKGFCTKVCNPETVKPMLLTFRPDVYIANRADHSNPAQKASQCCRVYIVPAEGAHLTKQTMLSVFMGRSFFKLESVAWISKCYLWGPQTFSWLMETNAFREDQLTVSGNCRLDVYKAPTLLKNIRAKKNEKFVLGVAFSSKSTSAYYGNPHYAESYFNMNQDLNFPIVPAGRHYEDICWRDHAILRRIMRLIKQFLEKEDGIIHFRPSPFEDYTEYQFLEKKYPGRVKVLPNQTLVDFLLSIDTLLTCWSTTGMEALITKTPVVSIAGLFDQQHLFNHISAEASGFHSFVPFYHQPKTEGEFFEMIQKAKANKLPPSAKTQIEIERLLGDVYNWKNPSLASQFIANDIEQDLQKFSVNRKSKQEWRKAISVNYPVPSFLLNFVTFFVYFLKHLKRKSVMKEHYFNRTNSPEVSKLVDAFLKERAV